MTDYNLNNYLATNKHEYSSDISIALNMII